MHIYSFDDLKFTLKIYIVYCVSCILFRTVYDSHNTQGKHNSLSIPYSLIICEIINSYCIVLTVY